VQEGGKRLAAFLAQHIDLIAHNFVLAKTDIPVYSNQSPQSSIG